MYKTFKNRRLKREIYESKNGGFFQGTVKRRYKNTKHIGMMLALI